MWGNFKWIKYKMSQNISWYQAEKWLLVYHYRLLTKFCKLVWPELLVSFWNLFGEVFAKSWRCLKLPLKIFLDLIWVSALRKFSEDFRQPDVRLSIFLELKLSEFSFNEAFVCVIHSGWLFLTCFFANTSWHVLAKNLGICQKKSEVDYEMFYQLRVNSKMQNNKLFIGLCKYR